MSFREVQLQDVLDIQWGDTKTTKASYVPLGYTAYSASGPDGFLEKFDYSEDGVVLSAIGANCGVTYFASGKWSCIKNTIRILRRSEDIDLAYFYYMTKAPDFWELRGSAQPFISQTDIRQKRIQIPEIAVQRFISSTLQALDHQIETNRSLSETLESIAQTLFRSWFVDFEPVRAKMAGEKPVGMDDATAALFPDSMVDSELGEIPDGWEFRTVDSILLRHPTQALPNSTPLERRGATLVLEQGNQVVAGFTSLEPDVVATVQSPKFIFGDHTCRMRLATIPFSVFPNTVVLYSSVVDTYWCFLATLGLQQFESYRRHWSELKIRNVILPNPELTWAFGEVVAPMFEQCDALLLQNALLSNIRDDLLPRLISGELEVPESLLVS